MIARLDTAARLAMFCWTIGISLAELLQMSRVEQLDFVRAAGGDVDEYPEALDRMGDWYRAQVSTLPPLRPVAGHA